MKKVRFKKRRMMNGRTMVRRSIMRKVSPKPKKIRKPTGQARDKHLINLGQTLEQTPIG